MKEIIIFLTAVFVWLNGYSQSVGIGIATPNASSQLDISSTTKGLLAPRMTFAQRNAVISPATGLLIYQTDIVSGFYYYNGTSWMPFSTGGSPNPWITNGNNIFSNNSGNVGIGVNPPLYKLDVDGRMRLRTGTVGSISTSSGIWMEDFRTGTNRIFFGMQDSIHVGFYGAGTGDVGWDFNFNATNGNVGIGADNPVEKLHVRGPVRLDPVGAFGGSFLKMYAATNIDNSYIYYYNQLSATNPSATIGYSGGNDYLLLNCGTGNVFLKSEGLGIGTASPTAKLHVANNVMIGSGSPAAGYLLSINGKMIAEEVRVELDAAWPDYVFDENYNLPSLLQLERFIQTKKHLPNIPPARQVKQDGIDLGDMNRRLLEKIEELTLYIIQQDKRLNLLQEQVNHIQPVVSAQSKIK